MTALTARRTTPVTAIALVVFAASLRAEGPSAEAIAAWDRYVTVAETWLEAEFARPGMPSMAAEDADARVARGEVVVEEAPARVRGSADVPDARIHHWRGRIFVPNVSIERLVATVRDPAGHSQEDVLEARLLERSDHGDRVYLKIRRSAIVTAAYNTEHRVTYRTDGHGRVRSRSVATRIAEIDGLGTPDEREKPPGTDRGFLWRMNAYWCYQPVAGGVMVTLDSITLSRAIPWVVVPIAAPVVDRVARESVVRTLRSLQARF